MIQYIFKFYVMNRLEGEKKITSTYFDDHIWLGMKDEINTCWKEHVVNNNRNDDEEF